MSLKDAIFVTRSTLPPLENYLDCVRHMFASRWMTNQGCYATQLEQELTSFLQVPALTLCANGTLALQLTLRLLQLTGKKVITTPFTYVATLSALLWEGCTPLFVDIDPQTLCIDPAEVEQCIKKHPDVAGILPVHIYGNACDVTALEKIAKQYALALIYDAAHAFGSTLDGKSLYTWGDASTASFHATKLFHTVEGGCVVTAQPALKNELKLLRAFGHEDENHVCLGINAKISELHAAMGVCLLPSVPELLKRRAYLSALYDEMLDMDGQSGLRRPKLATGLAWNHAYYPVIFPNVHALLQTMEALEKKGIQPRRYFYPCLTQLPYIKSEPCPVAEDMSNRVLCLPFWPDMEDDLVRNIAAIVRGVLHA